MTQSPNSGAKFNVGQLIHNTLLDYRGVVVDVDAHFRGLHGRADGGTAARKITTNMANRGPWYYILIDGSADSAYVAERNLEADPEGGPIDHPDIIDYFCELTDRGYHRHRQSVN